MLNASTTPGGHVRRTSRKCKPRNFPGRQIYPTHHAHAFRGPGFLFPRGVRCSLMYSREVTARVRDAVTRERGPAARSREQNRKLKKGRPPRGGRELMRKLKSSPPTRRGATHETGRTRIRSPHALRRRPVVPRLTRT